jgi:DNA-binding MarR family transcriptional regulator
MYSENTALIEGFRQICQSLKLYRRAELVDGNGDPLIDSLYVDPLPANKVLATLLEPHTTFLIGRKGTGKSTLFQKAQRDLLSKKYIVSAYLDIKTIFESSQIDPALAQRIDDIPEAIPRLALQRFLLHRAFLESLISAIKEQLRKRVNASLVARLAEKITGSAARLDQALDVLVQSLNIPTFESALGIVQTKISESRSDSYKDNIGGGFTLGANPSFNAVIGSEVGNSAAVSSDFTKILFRTLDLKAYIANLRDILSEFGTRQLYIFIDDYSELPLHAMTFVVDSLLAPLNNWSDELVKLKIAAYPGRIYFGEIDKTKIDEVYLDLYRLYAPSDVNSMENAATDFTKKLIERRFEKFLPGRLDEVFDTADTSLWRELFFVSLANPRILGYVLHFASERSVVKGGKITVKALKESARKYYEDKIEAYFAIGRFLHAGFAERLSIFSLKELLETIVSRSRDLRRHNSDTFAKINGVPPTSHFHVPTSLEAVLQSLELNFFLTKYFEMSDRSGQRVAVYCLNYGLCERYSIKFGRPSGEREFRLYFVERVFDFSTLIRAFLARNQEIVCGGCGTAFEHEQLAAIKLFGMSCPQCRVGLVSVTNLSRKYEADLRRVDENSLLGQTELGILSTLNSEISPLRPKDIAAELDCSYQLVASRGKGLEDRDLILREKQEGGQRLYRITAIAKEAYFDTVSSPLSLDDVELGR